MLARLRRRLSYANVMATTAMFIALGGSSYAAVTLTRNSVKSKHIAPNAITSTKVKDGALEMKDFKAGQFGAASSSPGERGPAGPGGAAGPAGPQGAKGETGTVDTSGFYSKSDSDARFLGKGDKATDADKLDGIDGSAFGTASVVDGVDFSPVDSTDLRQGGPNCVWIASGAAGSLVAPVHIPNGAKVTGVRFYVYDSSAAEPIYARVLTTNPAAYSATGTGWVSSEGSSGFETITFTFPAVSRTAFDGATRRLVLEAELRVNGTSHRICGARVDYTFD